MALNRILSGRLFRDGTVRFPTSISILTFKVLIFAMVSIVVSVLDVAVVSVVRKNIRHDQCEVYIFISKVFLIHFLRKVFLFLYLNLFNLQTEGNAYKIFKEYIKYHNKGNEKEKSQDKALSSLLIYGGQTGD
jgi:hypothetical protein